LPRAVSASRAMEISRHSWSTSGESTGREVRTESAFRACSCRPLRRRYRGDSGRRNICEKKELDRSAHRAGKVLERWRKPTYSDGENGSPGELDGNGSPPRGVVGSVLGGLVDDGGEEKTDGDGPLVETDNQTSELFGRAFGLYKEMKEGDKSMPVHRRRKGISWMGRTVHGDKARDDSDGKTSDDTADNEASEGDGKLESDSEAEEQAGGDETKLSTEEISDRGGSQSAEEGTRRQDGDDERGIARGEV
jgi:hypothetical protein